MTLLQATGPALDAAALHVEGADGADLRGLEDVLAALVLVVLGVEDPRLARGGEQGEGERDVSVVVALRTDDVVGEVLVEPRPQADVGAPPGPFAIAPAGTRVVEQDGQLGLAHRR